MSWFNWFGKKQNKNAKIEKVKEAQEDEAPQISINGHFDPEHGMVFEIDWNTTFIDELRSHGYTGTEEQIIQQYTLLTYRNIISDEEREGKQIG